MVGELLRPQRRGFDVLALARNLWSLGVVVNHVALASATGGINILFDCRGNEIGGCSGRLLTGDAGNVAYMMVRFATRGFQPDRLFELLPAPPRP